MLEEHISKKELGRKYGIDTHVLRDWIKRYEENGTEYFYEEHRGKQPIQGSIYSSKAFTKAHEHCTNIKRSMSRVATPTDNPIIEALNGWIKEELFIDFDLYSSKDVPTLINNYIHYFNNYRLSSKLCYKTPVQFRTEQGFP